MVGLGVAGTLLAGGLIFGVKGALRTDKPLSILQRIEESLAGLVRPNRIEDLPQHPLRSNLPPPPPPANTFFGSYRPPPPPPSAPLGIPRREGPRPPNPGWGEGRVHAPIYPRPPAPRVVGLLTEGRNEAEEHNDAGEGRFEGQDIRELRTQFDGEFRALRRHVDRRVSPYELIRDDANRSATE
jgi:hypothetical protein